jgi:hypothetical protein
MLILGDIGQMRKIRKSANDRIGLIACQFFQQSVKISAGLWIGLTPEAHGRLTNRLDNLENRVTFLMANHLTEQPPQ